MQVFDEAERAAVMRVLDSGNLSGFAATVGGHMGGPEVRALEEETADAYGSKYAVAVNSATSGLICAVGALILEPYNSKVAVTPYSMSASAACILPWGLEPKWVDIEPADYMMDWLNLGYKPTAWGAEVVLFVDLFGNLRRQHQQFPSLGIIEDASQAAGGRVNGKYAGTFGDMGVLSLNKYKVGGVGEGGIILTDHERYAERCRLIRNHGEVVVQEQQARGLLPKDHPNGVLMGFNFRLPEISAALAREQLKKLPGLVAERLDQARYLHAALSEMDHLVLPRWDEGVEPNWYRYPVRVKSAEVAKIYVNRLQLHNIRCKHGYVRPLHLQEVWGRRPPRLPVVESIDDKLVLLNVFGPGVERWYLDNVIALLGDNA